MFILHVLFQGRNCQEVQARSHVEVVFECFVGSFGLRNRTGREASLGNSRLHMHEAGEMIDFALMFVFHQCLVALSAAQNTYPSPPSSLVTSIASSRCGRGVGKYIGVAARRRAVHEALVADRFAVPQSSFTPVRCCSSLAPVLRLQILICIGKNSRFWRRHRDRGKQ